MTKEIEKQPAQVFEDFLAAAASMPGVRIDRETFCVARLENIVIGK